MAATYELPGAFQVVLVDRFFHGVSRQHLVPCYGLRMEEPAHVVVRKTNFCTHTCRWITKFMSARPDMNRRLFKKNDQTLHRANHCI